MAATSGGFSWFWRFSHGDNFILVPISVGILRWNRRDWDTISYAEYIFWQGDSGVSGFNATSFPLCLMIWNELNTSIMILHFHWNIERIWVRKNRRHKCTWIRREIVTYCPSLFLFGMKTGHCGNKGNAHSHMFPPYVLSYCCCQQ